MTDTPEDWAFERACSWVGRKPHHVLSMAVDNPERRAISALCDMIAKHEQPPVDRKLLCAQAAVTGALIELDASRFPKKEYMWDCCVRAIEQHEAFRQEVSDAIQKRWMWDMDQNIPPDLQRFIIPKPDPLVEVMDEMGFGLSNTASEELRAALAARGLEITEKSK